MGQTPLITAVSKNKEESINSLLDHHANINYANADKGNTPLIVASQEGFPNIVDLLLKRGADISQVNSIGRRALHYASFRDPEGCIECVKVLLNYGDDIEARDEEGDTPLILAAYFGNIYIYINRHIKMKRERER